MRTPMLSFLLMLGSLSVTNPAEFAAAAAQAPDSAAALAPRTLYLVRHGLYDEADPRDEAVGKGLVPAGREQARLAGERLAGLGVRFDALWTSPLTRARESADIVAQSLPGLAPAVVPELAECTPPTWRQDVARTLAADEAAACRARLEQAFGRFCVPSRDGERHEILVCHGNVIRWLWCRALGVDPDAWLGLTIANASLTVIQARPDGSCKLYLFGDVGHLPAALLSYPGGTTAPWAGAALSAPPAPSAR